MDEVERLLAETRRVQDQAIRRAKISLGLSGLAILISVLRLIWALV